MFYVLFVNFITTCHIYLETLTPKPSKIISTIQPNIIFLKLTGRKNDFQSQNSETKEEEHEFSFTDAYFVVLMPFHSIF